MMVSIKKLEDNTLENEMVYAVPEKQVYKEYIEKALNDGWVPSEGPWGSNEHDRSVTLKKRLDDLNGSLMLRLVDRDFGNRRYNRATSEYDITRAHDYSASGWFVEDSIGKGYAPRDQSLMELDVTEYDMKALLKEVNSCNVCRKEVGVKKLIPVFFSNAACADCAPAMKQRLETPGWYN